MKMRDTLGAPLRIGGYTAPCNVLLAPLAGYTDFAFRKLCYSFGAGLCFTEMVSAKGLLYGNEGTRRLLHRDPSEPQTAVQLFGGDPAVMRAACESEDLAGFAHVDINMGCPVPKVYKNGEGSALLSDFPRAEKIVAACKKSGKTVSVKFRIGLDGGHVVAAEFARLCAGAGADMLTVHGRTRDKMYAGEPDYAAIAAAKNAVDIPVVANGGIFTRGDALRMLGETGADGVMVARAAMYCPHVFAEILGRGGEWDVRAAIEGQIADMLPFYGERFTLVQMRKMAAFYLRGTRGGAGLRARLLACPSLGGLHALLEEIFGGGAEGLTSGPVK